MSGGTYDYCVVCRRNFSDGRRHMFQQKHKDNLDYRLQKEKTKIEDVRFFISCIVPLNNNNNKNDSGSSSSSGLKDISWKGSLTNNNNYNNSSSSNNNHNDNNFWCLCCQKEIDESNSKYASYETIRHLASGEHKQQVMAFLKKYCTEANKYDPIHYIISKNKLKEFKMEIKDYERRQKEEQQGVLASQQQQQQQQQQQKEEEEEEEEEDIHQYYHPTNTPATATAPAPVTVYNEFGVAQNPTGRHVVDETTGETRRVWGGGIVKYKTTTSASASSSASSSASGRSSSSSSSSSSNRVMVGEWIPWPIDLLDEESDTFDASSILMGGKALEHNNNKATNPLLWKKNKKKNNEIQPRQLQAVGSNLTAVKVRPLAPGEHNVHTAEAAGVLPPWLIIDDDDDDEKQKKNEKKPLSELEQLEREVKKKKERERLLRKNPNRIGAEQVRRRQLARLERRGDGDGDAEEEEEEEEEEEDWLPSFGRTFQSGPRSHSKREFLSELK